MVTAKGEKIEVSETSYPDLFWAIRGAGGNFGVVTSATYKVHPLANGGQVLSADLYFPANASSEYFKAVETLSKTWPANLASNTVVIYNSTIGDVSSHCLVTYNVHKTSQC
jgi:FAD/FMN-containing dehydrogenase